LQISQGSGASVTILTGKTAVVYLDGAGSGAAVVDAMAGVDPGVTDTLAEVLAAGNTSGANNLIIDNGQAITTNTINETTAASGVTIDSVLLKDDGVNATNLEITNLKANDGTSAGSIADSTGVVTLASLVATTADINAGTIDNTVIGGTTAAAGSFTTGSFSETTFVGLTARPAGVPATAGRLWAAQDETGNYGIASKASTTDSFTYIGNTGTKATLGQSYGSTGSYLPLVLQTSDLDRLTISAAGAATFSSTVAGAFNGTLGATTPASVAATTLSTTGAATFGGNVAIGLASTNTWSTGYAIEIGTEQAATLHNCQRH
jgi:trimeric autotransporter adhesin